MSSMKDSMATHSKLVMMDLGVLALDILNALMIGMVWYTCRPNHTTIWNYFVDATEFCYQTDAARQSCFVWHQHKFVTSIATWLKLTDSVAYIYKQQA